MLAPDAEDIRNAATSTLTNINQVEHLQHRTVPRVGYTAAFRRVHLNTEAARIGHGDAVPLFNNDQSLPAIIIGMNQAICQRLAQCFMHICIVHSGTALHFEGHFDVLNQLVVDPEIEVIHITAPIARGGNDTICPTGIGIILLLIVQKECVEFPHNIVLVAKHEKSGRGGMLLSVRADAHGTQLQKEIFILQRFPHMAGSRKTHSLTVAADALLVEHRQVHFVQNQHILRLYRCVAHHSLIFLLGAAIVALTVTAVCAERIAVHIHRFIGALGTGDIDDHDMIAIDLLHKYIFG